MAELKAKKKDHLSLVDLAEQNSRNPIINFLLCQFIYIYDIIIIIFLEGSMDGREINNLL
jgi:hypothetical protein